MALEDRQQFDLMEKKRVSTGLSWSERLYFNKSPDNNRTLVDTLFYYILNVHHPQAFAKRGVIAIGHRSVGAALRAQTLGARTVTVVLPSYAETDSIYAHVRSRYCYVADINKCETPPMILHDYGFMFGVESFVSSPKAYRTIKKWANFMFVEGGFSRESVLSREETERCLKQHFSFVARIKKGILNTETDRYDDEESSLTSRTLWLARR